MSSKTTGLVPFKSEQDLLAVLDKQYKKAIENFFGDPKLALEFGSNVRASIQRLPALMECTPDSLINSFITMASLKLMPSGVSGEAFVLPYKNKGTMEAQFQLGYPGLVTLFYRAGIRSIVAEIVHQKDHFEYLNGEVRHTVNPFSNRGEAIGAYVILELPTGGKIYKVMSKEEILEIAKRFSKSYGSDFSPWNEKSDPQRWMWRKTVLKQAAKLAPKNPELMRAIAEDDKDSVISDRRQLKEAAPEYEVAVEPEEFVNQLRLCKTPAGLTAVWADFPVEAKTNAQVRACYEEMKAIIGTEAKEAGV